MTDECVNLSGQIDSEIMLFELASRLRASGVGAEIRESCHYERGVYIRLDQESVHFTVESIAVNEYLVRAESDSIQPMLQVASQVSCVLSELDIRHRFEIYDKQASLINYLHYLWSQTSADV